MSVRVSEFQNSREFLFYHAKSQLEETTTLEHIASGKKINRASEGPVDFERARLLKTQIEENTDFTKSIETMLSEFNVVESSMNAMLSGLERAAELAVQGANETYGANARNTIADELDELYNSMISTLNTRHEGRYLFSGSATGTQPFDSSGNYLGNSAVVSVRISNTDTLAGNIPGDEVAFGPGGAGSANDFLDLIQSVSTALRADNTAGITANLPRFKPTIDRVNSLIAGIGSKTARLVSNLSFYQDFEVNLQETMSDLEDADMAEEISILNQNKVTQEAQLRSQASLSKLSLLDYLG
jgi:flagellar hook-associated protein 3 FlgL